MSEPFQDDPSISSDERLYRRIPPSWVYWDDQGTAIISSAAFKEQELSICLDSTMMLAGRSPSDLIARYPGYGLAAITAGLARANEQTVARDPLEEEPAHGIVYGPKKRGGIAGRLRDGALWIIEVSR